MEEIRFSPPNPQFFYSLKAVFQLPRYLAPAPLRLNRGDHRLFFLTLRTPHDTFAAPGLLRLPSCPRRLAYPYRIVLVRPYSTGSPRISSLAPDHRIQRVLVRPLRQSFA